MSAGATPGLDSIMLVGVGTQKSIKIQYENSVELRLLFSCFFDILNKELFYATLTTILKRMIQMKRLRWLHISDLHFGYNPSTVETMREKLISHVKDIGHIDFLFITGDLRYGKLERNSYPKEATEFIINLQQALNINKTATFLVPGNHDVNRTEEGEHEVLVNKAKAKYKTATGAISSETLDYIQGRREPFLQLYKEICGRDEPSIHYCFETEHVNIIHINTAIMSSADGEDGGLIIGSQLLKSMAKKINRDKPGIVLAHHGFDALTIDEQRELEIVLKENNAVLYLCGHKHVALSDNVKISRQDKDLWVYLCGTNMDQDPQIGETDMDVFVGEIDVDSLQGYVHAYRWSKKNSTWMSDPDFSFPQNAAQDGKHYFPPNTRPIPPSSDYKDILKMYHQYIEFECGEIQLSGLPGNMDVVQKKFDLEELFVPLSFSETKPLSESSEGSFATENSSPLMLSDIIPTEGNFHISLLSGPGSGKTTLLKWIASVYCFPEKYIDKNTYLPTRDLLPIWIKCRDIDFSKRPTISEDIISDVTNRAEIMTDTDSKNDFLRLVHSCMQNGTALLLIDGLDEINEDSDRQYFVRTLNRFINANSSINILFTSRIAGYSAITSEISSDFVKYEILPFSDSNIRELCVKWHLLVDGDRDLVRKEATLLADTIVKHKKIRTLACNPLMLTTLLLVKRRVGRLPTKRVALYSEAIQVLLETWNFEVFKPIDLDEARYQLAYVAYQMMVEQKQTIKRSELSKLLILARKELPEYISSIDSIPEFVKKVERRSALLIQKGYIVNDASGETEAVYEFQHLTFQEYLAAYAIVKKCYQSAQEDDRPCYILEKYLRSKYMKEVVLLSSVLLEKGDVRWLAKTIIKLMATADCSINEKEYLRSLLLQIVADEAPLTPDFRSEILDYCFNKSMRHEDIDIIKTILMGKYAEEFRSFIETLDNKKDVKTPSYTITINHLEKDSFAEYEFYINNSKSTDTEIVIEAILALDTALWIDREKTLEPLDISQKNMLKEDLFAFANNNDPKIQKAAFSGLRMSDLIDDKDIGRYFQLVVSFVNKTNSVPPILNCITNKNPIIDYSIQGLTLSGVDAIITAVSDAEITSQNDYSEKLTLLLILLLFGNNDLKSIHKDFEDFKLNIANYNGNEWPSYKNADDIFIKLLNNVILENNIVPVEKKLTTQEYINNTQNIWELIKKEKRDALFKALDMAEKKDDKPTTKKQSNFNVDELVKRIDQKIAELERLEEEKKKKQNEEAE